MAELAEFRFFMTEHFRVFALQWCRFAGNGILRQQFFYFADRAVPHLRTNANLFALSSRDPRRNLAAERILKFGQSQAEVVQSAGNEKFDKFTAVDIVADLKDGVVAIPFDNGTGKQPVAKRTRIFIVLDKFTPTITTKVLPTSDAE